MNGNGVGPSYSWDGHLDFKKIAGQLVFSGKEYGIERTPEGLKRTLLLEISNGKAKLIDSGRLAWESDVEDHHYGRRFHWTSVEPFQLIPGFLGRLRPQKPEDPNLESAPWGMMIYKKSEGM